MLNGTRVVDRPIRWAMIGGGQGSQIGYIHRAAALRDGNFELVAGAFDADPERGMTFGRALGIAPERCYPDYETMLREERKRPDGIEAVSIAAPNHLHYRALRAALEAGLHAVCEKPLCFTAAEAGELVALAKKKGRIVGVTYGYAGHQMIQQARQMLRRGDLGDVRVINMSFAFGGYNTRVEQTNAAARWRFDPEKAGPSFALGDVGTHPMYLLEAIAPDLSIDSLMCTTRAFVEGRRLEDNAFVIMNLNASHRIQQGAQAYLWASSINSGARHGHLIRVVGSKASIEWNDERPNQLLYEVDGEPSRVLERGAGYLYPEARVEDRIGGGHAEGLLDAWNNLYRRFAVAMSGAEAEKAAYGDFWYPDLSAGAQGVRWIEKCLQSAKNGCAFVPYDA